MSWRQWKEKNQVHRREKERKNALTYIHTFVEDRNQNLGEFMHS